MISSTTGNTIAPGARAGARQPRRARAERGEFCFYLDSRGGQYFNFRQRIWLHASVAMAVTPVMTLALETLAINLLTGITRERDYRAAVGVTSRRAVRLARPFCYECLLTARADGWVMPRASLEAWLESHEQTRSRKRR